MAGGNIYKDDEIGGAITDINVTPFVDVVLVLLIIFMVTARLIVARGVDIQKPEAATGGDVKGLLIAVDQAGTVHVNGDPFATDDAAIARIKVVAKAMSKPKAIISGDARAAYGGVMRAIDLVKRAGVDAIALENVAPAP